MTYDPKVTDQDCAYIGRAFVMALHRQFDEGYGSECLQDVFKYIVPLIEIHKIRVPEIAEMLKEVIDKIEYQEMRDRKIAQVESIVTLAFPQVNGRAPESEKPIRHFAKPHWWKCGINRTA